MRELHVLLGSCGSDERAEWLRGIATYEQAYIQFMTAPSAKSTEQVFEQSAAFETWWGRPLGRLISLSKAYDVRIRRASVDLTSIMDELGRIRDALAPIRGPLARSWVETSLPVYLGYANLLLRKDAKVIEAVTAVADTGFGGALYYRGVARVRGGDLAGGTIDLEQARRAFYREQQSEGRAAVLVSQGDAYHLDGRRDEAHAIYGEALKQPAYMHNFAAIEAARQRLKAGNHPVSSAADIYVP
jgi:hypothetical protein